MASAPSSSGPVEAPVNTLTRNFCPRKFASAMRRASSVGTALGYPDPVNPLIPIWSPDSISAAASSALMIFRTSPACQTRAPARLVEVSLLVAPVEAVVFVAAASDAVGVVAFASASNDFIVASTGDVIDIQPPIRNFRRGVYQSARASRSRFAKLPKPRPPPGSCQVIRPQPTRL